MSNIYFFLKNKTVFSEFTLNEAKRFFKNNSENFYGSYFNDIKKASIYSAGQSVRSRQIEDIKKFSVPSICHFEDRLSMLNSVEVRYPFLDNNLIELLISLPTEKKLYKGWTKYIFRKTFEKFLPKKIVWRKDKNGFSTDFDEKIKDKYYYNYVMHNYFNDKAIIFKEKIVEKESLINSLINFYDLKDKRLSTKKIFALISLEEWLRSNKSIISFNEKF